MIGNLMRMPRTMAVLIAFALLRIVISDAYAEVADVDGGYANQPAYSVAVTPVYDFSSRLDKGGRMEAFKLQFDAGALFAVNDELQLGLRMGYSFNDYHFSTAAFSGGISPWDTVHQLELGGSVKYGFSPDWTLLLVPALQFSRAENAGWANALTYGGVISLNRRFSPNLTLGFGAAAFSTLEDVTAFPVIALKWQISDRLLLSNPLRPGPAGRAGLELSYRISDSWDTGIGCAYRSSRFRLPGSNANPDGIGETTSVPSWVRISGSWGSSLSLDLYGGVSLGGEVRLEDKNGGYLASDSYDPAPFMAVSFTGRF